MKLSETTLNELGQIIKDDYGLQISMEKVANIAYGLVNYFDFLAKIYHENVRIVSV